MADKPYTTRTRFKRDGKRYMPGEPVTLDSKEGDELVKRKVLTEGGEPKRTPRRAPEPVTTPPAPTAPAVPPTAPGTP